MGVGDWFKIGVVGESFQNANGQNRQNLIYALCKDGCKISLRREPDNPHDSDSVAVWVSRQGLLGLAREEGQIGYVPAGHLAHELASWIDRGGTVGAKFFSRHGEFGKPGVVIEARRMGEPSVVRSLPKSKPKLDDQKLAHISQFRTFLASLSDSERQAAIDLLGLGDRP